jgi:hypothetical protein
MTDDRDQPSDVNLLARAGLNDEDPLALRNEFEGSREFGSQKVA